MKKITQKKFFECLGECAKAHGFKINVPKCPPYDGNFSLVRQKKTQACPITAVCRLLTNQKASPLDYEKAAKLAGIDEKFADKIVDAADCVNREIKLRKRILKAVGLS